MALALLLCLTCDTEESLLQPGQFEVPEPSLAIVDGTDPEGNPFFHWQKPIAAKPYKVTGKFAEDLYAFLRVEVCEWNGTGCEGNPIVRFSADEEGTEPLRMLASAEKFQALWRTKNSDLDPDKIYRISVKVGYVELGYADVDVVKKVKEVDTDEFVAVVGDRTLPIVFTVEEGAAHLGPPTVTVTEDLSNEASVEVSSDAGASVETSGGAGADFSLTVPDGAVLQPTAVSITPIVSLGSSLLGSVFIAGVQMEPEGLTLFKPATLEITLPPGTPTDGIVGFASNGDGTDFHFVPATAFGSVVTLQISHFSTAGVAESCVAMADEQLLSPQAYADNIASCIAAAAQDRDGTFPDNMTQEERTAIQVALANWYYEVVEPLLSDGAACLDDQGCSQEGGEHLLLLGIQEYTVWKAKVQQFAQNYFGGPFDLDVYFSGVYAQAEGLERIGVLALRVRFDVKCWVAETVAELDPILGDYQHWESIDQALGLNVFPGAPPPKQMAPTCQPFLYRYPVSLNVDSETIEVRAGSNVKTLASVTSRFGVEIDNPRVQWESLRPEIASAYGKDAFGRNAIGIIEGVKAGTTQVKVTHTFLDLKLVKYLNVEVLPKPGSLTGRVAVQRNGDPAWIGVPGFRIRVTDSYSEPTQTLLLTTDAGGSFSASDLEPGNWSVDCLTCYPEYSSEFDDEYTSAIVPEGGTVHVDILAPHQEKTDWVNYLSGWILQHDYGYNCNITHQCFFDREDFPAWHWVEVGTASHRVAEVYAEIRDDWWPDGSVLYTIPLHQDGSLFPPDHVEKEFAVYVPDGWLSCSGKRMHVYLVARDAWGHIYRKRLDEIWVYDSTLQACGS
jgi:hypothetical protein